MPNYAKMKVIKYIKSRQTIFLERKETLFYKSINVIIKDPLPENISINNILAAVEHIIPRHLVYNVEAIYVGHFKMFDQRNINALYQDGALYISNEQDNEEDMIDDIVHEIAHSAEEKYWAEIYGDGELEREFLSKREKLYEILASYEYPVNYEQFINPEYDDKFDSLLYNKIGYEKLEHFVIGLFPSNYSITSLREYFGIGFEYYFLRDGSEFNELANISPVLYNKIYNLINMENV